MDKEIIKRIIVAKQEEIAKTEIVRRELVVEPTANYVFVGLRRAGKSYLVNPYQPLFSLLSAANYFGNRI
jgi:predicted AAA+ superfamily ATPase